MKNTKIKDMVQCAIFSAIIVVMTLVPYTGYINYGLFIEITTLHIVVIIGAIRLGWKYGAVLGGVWGITCVARAFTNPAWLPFTNPLISVLPRIMVGVVAGIVFYLLCKRAEDKPVKEVHSIIAGVCAGAVGFAGVSQQEWQLWVKIVIAIVVLTIVAALFLWLNNRYQSWKAYAAAIAALCASLTNTVLVLTAFNLFGGMIDGYQTFFNIFQGILSTLIGINGSIELLAAVLITPVLTMALSRARKA